MRASGHSEGTSPERKRGTAPNSVHDLHATLRTQRATCGHLPRRCLGIRPLTLTLYDETSRYLLRWPVTGVFIVKTETQETQRNCSPNEKKLFYRSCLSGEEGLGPRGRCHEKAVAKQRWIANGGTRNRRAEQGGRVGPRRVLPRESLSSSQVQQY